MAVGQAPSERRGERTALSRHLLRTARRACLAAGAALPREAARTADAKSDDFDLVTEADRRAESMICDILLSAFPDSSIVGEENGTRRGRDGICWHVDPIDGTNNFVRGLPFYCVSIGVEIGGRLEAGSIYDPVGRELFVGGPDGLALNGRPVPVKPPSDTPPVLLSDFPRCGSRPGPAESALMADLIGEFDLRRIGSTALALAYVAVGRADAALNVGIRSWDVAAGIALIAAAGGVYSPIFADAEQARTESPAAAPAFVACTRAAADRVGHQRIAWRLAALTDGAQPPRHAGARTDVAGRESRVPAR